MEEPVRKLNREYGFELSEEEIQLIAQQAQAYEQLFRCLYTVDLGATAPLLKLEKSR